ncbi:MAG: amidohydrolase family protein [Vicinamibacterales bacterium]
MRSSVIWWLARVGVVLLTAAAVVACAGPKQHFDLVIANGTVVDGTGSPGVRADVGITGGRIVEVGQIEDVSDAPKKIDATGLVVSPGFIDLHTHGEDIAGHPLAENFVRMGVTTIVAGNCGGSDGDIGAALDKIAAAKPAINYLTLVGHNTVRRAVMGTERRSATPEELARMKDLVRAAMAAGAFGLSTGLQYVPGSYSETSEIVELAKAAAEWGGLYASHMRSEGTTIEQAIAEAIAVGEGAGCPVHISHLKIDSPNRWGQAQAILGQIDEARKRGLEIHADQYAYTAASSSLGIRFPSWALEGGREKTAERLKDAATWKRIKAETKALLAERGISDLSFAVVASYEADPSFNGLSMKEVAKKLKGAEDADAQLEAAREMMLAGGASMVYHFMSEDDVRAIMRDPDVSVGSDSSVLTPGEGAPHPRGYGNTARILGRYVREDKVISLEEAVRKLTSLAASQFGLSDRGRLAEGYAADIVIFDPAGVIDKASYEQPHQFAAGMPYVIVNGITVIEQGEDTGARPGQVIRHKTAPKP